MLIREMTEDECRDVLERVSFGRLACARDNQPYVVPIYFSYDGPDLYGFSTPGQKIEWMRSNPLICLEVDERTSHDRWMSVIVLGRLRGATGYARIRRRPRAGQEALHKRATWWEYASIPGAEWRRKRVRSRPSSTAFTSSR